jgi:hypothetical protein
MLEQLLIIQLLHWLMKNEIKYQVIELELCDLNELNKALHMLQNWLLKQFLLKLKIVLV